MSPKSKSPTFLVSAKFVSESEQAVKHSLVHLVPIRLVQSTLLPYLSKSKTQPEFFTQVKVKSTL